jgi:hypothetical protein
MEIKDLELKLIDALVEAKTARLIAEKALSLVTRPNSQVLEPWGEPPASPPTQSSPAPFIKVVETSPKPSLAGFRDKVPQNGKETTPLVDDFFEDEVLGTVEDEI